MRSTDGGDEAARTALAKTAGALLAAWDGALDAAGRPAMRVFRTRIPTPFLMACYEGDHVCDDIFTNGFRTEYALGLGSLIEELRPGIDTMIDFGANTGFFGIAAAMRDVRVLAVEPANAGVCRLNAFLINGLSPLYELHEVALVLTPGQDPLTQTVPWANLGGSTFVKKEETTNWTALFNEDQPHRDVVMATVHD